MDWIRSDDRESSAPARREAPAREGPGAVPSRTENRAESRGLWRLSVGESRETRSNSMKWPVWREVLGPTLLVGTLWLVVSTSTTVFMSWKDAAY